MNGRVPADRRDQGFHDRKADTRMASSNKRKTTMAKLNRERGLVERRLAKQAKKAARKLAAANGDQAAGESSTEAGHEPPADQIAES